METNNTTRLPLDWFRAPSNTLHTPALRADRSPESMATTQRIQFRMSDAIANLNAMVQS